MLNITSRVLTFSTSATSEGVHKTSFFSRSMSTSFVLNVTASVVPRFIFEELFVAQKASSSSYVGRISRQNQMRFSNVCLFTAICCVVIFFSLLVGVFAPSVLENCSELDGRSGCTHPIRPPQSRKRRASKFASCPLSFWFRLRSAVEGYSVARWSEPE